jgi:uncharacterized membrane protein HdeD (DUF308 family)
LGVVEVTRFEKMTAGTAGMLSWMRAIFVIIGVLSVIISFAALYRPWLSIEIVLLLIPLVLLINGISWIIHGAAGR